MVGITLVFNKRVQVGTDAMNNPTWEISPITIDNCLVSPELEPAPIREQQAKSQTRERVRIHLPKTSTDDISDSTVVWDAKTFMVDSMATKFMDENTPGAWNRYFRAEAVNG